MSPLFEQGIRLEIAALLVGHNSQAAVEVVYRRQLRPVITKGAEVMEDQGEGNPMA